MYYLDVFVRKLEPTSRIALLKVGNSSDASYVLWFNLICPKIDTWNTQKDPFNLLYISVVK